MAKISKLFRLSEDAIAILNTKPNASRFVEDLILKGGEGISRGESMILDLMQNMVDLNTVQTKLLTTPPITNDLSSNGRTEAFEASNLGSSPSESAKITPSDIMEDINNLTAARDDELMWCQDTRETKRIKDEYQIKINEAWKAFHATKTQTSPPTA